MSSSSVDIFPFVPSSSENFTPIFTSTFESGSLSQLLQSVPPQHLEESVVIIEEVINLDASSDTMDVSGQTIGDTIELSSGLDSSNTGETMVSQETSSNNSSDGMEESNSSTSEDGYIYNCPVHNHHLNTSNASVCPDDPTCTCLQ